MTGGRHGDLTIAGVTQPVTVHGRLADRRVQGSATIAQTRWGIRPYTGLFGALKHLAASSTHEAGES